MPLFSWFIHEEHNGGKGFRISEGLLIRLIEVLQKEKCFNCHRVNSVQMVQRCSMSKTSTFFPFFASKLCYSAWIFHVEVSLKTDAICCMTFKVLMLAFDGTVCTSPRHTVGSLVFAGLSCCLCLRWVAHLHGRCLPRHVSSQQDTAHKALAASAAASSAAALRLVL